MDSASAMRIVFDDDHFFINNMLLINPNSNYSQTRYVCIPDIHKIQFDLHPRISFEQCKSQLLGART